jgi:tetratricopeptide (TPR) repeat protein
MSPDAVHHYIEAAREAKQIFAHHQIIQYGCSSLSIADTAQTLNLLSLMADAYRMLGQWAEVESTCRTWLERADHNIPLEQKATMEISLGNCLRLQGKYQKALLHLEKSRRHYELLEHRAGLAEAYGHTIKPIAWRPNGHSNLHWSHGKNSYEMRILRRGSRL